MMGCADGQVMGTWREGFTAAFTKAASFESWDAMADWAEDCSDKTVLPLKTGRSSDLSGGRHTYINTHAGGMRDGCQSLVDEMRFIGLHNSGDSAHFLSIMKEWIRMQDTKQIIPPGHF